MNWKGPLLTAGLGLLFLGRYAHYRRHLEEHEHIRDFDFYHPLDDPGFSDRLTRAQVALLGYAHSFKLTPEKSPSLHIPRSSYLYHPEEKPAGVLRIGAFGDSFVQGEGSAYGFDYPSLLQACFRRAGRADVEVVNFGTSGYGVHQSYTLWKILGSRYRLDYALFYVEAFHLERDRTFNNYGFDHGPLHARYALDGAGLRAVQPAGATQREALAGYYGLLPRWRYLRYDARAPVFLRMWLPERLQESAVNPFFYKGPAGWRDEVRETYARIFSDVARECPHVVVYSDSAELIRDLRARIAAPNVYLHASGVWDRLRADPVLYASPYGHHSALGYEVRAEELFALLAGQPAPKVKTLAWKPVPLRQEGVTSRLLPPSARFQIEGQPFGRWMALPPPDQPGARDERRLVRWDHPEDWMDHLRNPDYLDLGKIKKSSGWVEMVGKDAAGRTLRVPVAEYRLSGLDLPAFAAPYPDPIRIRPFSRNPLVRP